jgi:hypothetical protein
VNAQATYPQRMLILPRGQKFVFDTDAARIISEARARNFNVPGVHFRFYSTGRGDELFGWVSEIHIPELGVSLHFWRDQGKLGAHWRDQAGLSRIIIPGRELQVYGDDSSPRYFVYIGEDWARDQEAFRDAKFDGLLGKEPGRYLAYSQWSGSLGGRDSMSLEHHAGVPQETYALAEETIDTQYALSLIQAWLRYRALPFIRKHPVANVDASPFVREPVPVPEHAGSLYCVATAKDAQRVASGRADRYALAPDERYGLWHPVCKIGVVTNSDYDAYAPWQPGCAIGSVYVFSIRPRTAEGIMVTDRSIYEGMLRKFWDKMPPGRDRLLESELYAAEAAERATSVPLVDYDGTFDLAWVHFHREVLLDEVELVSGPWPECQYVRMVAAAGGEAARTLDLALLANAQRGSSLSGPEFAVWADALTDFLAALLTVEGFSHAYADSCSHAGPREQVDQRSFAGSIVRTAATMRSLGLH